MLKGICYNASRQERRKCSLWHAKSPGVATSGAFLFRCGKVAYALGWLPPIYLRPAICRCSRRLHLPRQRVRKTKIYSWWHTPFLYLYRGGNIIPSTISVTTSFLAVYLTFRRSPYFALAYAANDIVLIILWILASLYDIRYVSVVVCFIAFFANDIYGFVSWRKMKTRQQEITNVVSIM